jgi:IS1 family transposase
VFVRVNGVQHHLWRAVDHEGEVLEAFVTKRRDKAAAPRFLKKLMKLHGRAEELVTDKLRSYRAALKELGGEDRGSRRGGRTTERRTPTSPFDDAIARCSASGGCTPSRSSPPSTPPSTTTSTQSAASPPETTTRPPAPPL